jgi:hypothetical protein
MLRVDQTSKILIPVAPTTLTQASILERMDLQAAALKSWDAFCSELGFEELFLVGSEIVPHESCRDRIDILALSRDGAPVVFELKRHRDRLQLLQAISYSAMVARWDAQRFLKELTSRDDEEAQELRSLLSEASFEFASPRIVLIAESFDPEVILAADWLSDFGVPISAYAVSAVSYRDETLITIDQRFPLPGVDDVYVRRTPQAGSGGEPRTTWEEAMKDIRFPFAKRALAIFRRRIEGSPERRAFFSIYAGSPLGRLRIIFRRNYLKIYADDSSLEAEQALRSRLGTGIDVKRWGSETTKNSGFTFTIETEEQFNQFLRAVGDADAPGT